MGMEDIGVVQPQQQDPTSQALVLDEAYKSGYYDASGGRKQASNFDTKMMQMLVDCPLPSDNKDFDNYLEMIRTVINILPRIPNYDMPTYREIVRDFEDIVDQAHSEGMSRVTASDMCKMIIRLRAIVPAGGQFKMEGLTAVSAIITTRHQSESTVKVPQQSQAPSGGTFGFLNPFNWGKK
jgi:hypothetical protein